MEGYTAVQVLVRFAIDILAESFLGYRRELNASKVVFTNS